VYLGFRKKKRSNHAAKPILFLYVHIYRALTVAYVLDERSAARPCPPSGASRPVFLTLRSAADRVRKS
jgi:hypothetical protein